MAARPRNILVGYDGSEEAKRALDAAADLAGYGSTLAVVPVADDGAARHEDLVSEARQRLLLRHATARYVEPIGDPAEVLVEKARELAADLVVVGRSSALQLRALGRAPCDVLVVR